MGSANYLATVRRREAGSAAKIVRNLASRATDDHFIVWTEEALESLRRSVGVLADAEESAYPEHEGNACEVLREVRDSFLNGGWQKYREPGVAEAVAGILASWPKPTKLLRTTSMPRWPHCLISASSQAPVSRASMKKKKYLIETSAVLVAMGGSTADHRDEFQRTVADGALFTSLYIRKEFIRRWICYLIHLAFYRDQFGNLADAMDHANEAFSIRECQDPQPFHNVVHA